MAGYEKLGMLHDMFARQAALTPDSVAIVSPSENKTLTFGELEAKANLLAWKLRSKGVVPDSCVGIYMDKSVDFAVTYIAILKAGGAYLPIDTSYPQHMVQAVLEDAEPKAVCVTPAYLDMVKDLIECVVMDEGWDERLRGEGYTTSLPPNPPDLNLDSLAYVVYSSGTTGKPKGIMCPHRGAVFSYQWRLLHFPYSGGDREAANIFFVWEMLRPLLKGVPMYVLPNLTIYDPVQFCAFLADHAITRILVTPSLLETVLNTRDVDLPQAFKTLREVIFCGEVVTTALFERCMRVLPWIKFVNLYSISECHDVACVDLTAVYQADKETLMSRKFCPVGKVLEGVHVVILNDEGQPQHVGQPGEIYVGGPTLARGYVKRPDVQALRFVPRPSAVPAHFGPLLYRTGDWGYTLSDGSLEICGRCDSMVKIRGYSIEVQAVEAALLSLTGVHACVVLVEGQEGQDKFLVAYVVPEQGVSKKDVRAALKRRLPFYMIPAYFVFLSSIPVVAATGKLDKKALPSLQQVREESEDADCQPSTATEVALAPVWAGVLQLPHVDTQESFFDLGGHSLLAAELLSQVRSEFQVELSAQDLFSQPTLASLARLIDSRLGLAPPTSPPRPALDFQAEVMRHDQGKLNLDMELRAFWRTFHHRHHFRRGRLLLTGATGFLGAFLLRELILNTKLLIYALVRELPGIEPKARLEKTLRQFGVLHDPESGTTPTQNQILVKQLLPERVTAIKGNVALENLGMRQDDYVYLTTDVDVVVHAAATVNLAYPYSALYGPNVLGTANILVFAYTGKVKPVHYISTDAVFPPGLRDCRETDTAEAYGQQLSDGYSQSKWVAEQLCHKAIARGLPITIYRLGNLGGDREQANWNPQDFTLLVLQECARSGLAPDVTWEMEMTPVDFSAEAIVRLMQDPESISKTFHLINTSPLQAKWVFEWMRAHKYPLSFLPFSEWREHAMAKGAKVGGNGSPPRNEHLVRLLETYITDESFFTSLSTYNRDLVEAALDRLGLKYPRVDSAQLQLYFDQLSARHVIARRRRPTFSSVTALLEDRVAVVTGASSGIGAAVATALSAAGAKVAMAARRVDRLKELESEITESGGVAIAVPTDITDRTQVKELVRHAETTLGPVDFLINCAGVMYYTMMKNLKEDEWERQIDINCKGTTNAIGAVLTGMLERKSGHIVSITSDAARRGFAGLAVYSGTKFYLEGLCQALRHEVCGSGVRVTCIQPGDVKTELLSHTTDKEAKDKYDGSGSCHILDPQDVAKAVIYAVSQPEHVGINEILIEPREAPI